MTHLVQRVFPLVLVLLAFTLQGAWAGAVIEINEDASIDLGFRLQTLYLHTDQSIDEDPKFETFDDFRIRRARLRVGADVTEWFHAFLQTEFAEDEGTGGDMRVIDAFIQLKPHPLANLFVGENMVPVSRQNLTSSGALMAVDRPAITYKNLTWGTRALLAFATRTYAESDAGLRGDVDVRDTGATLFGTHSLTDDFHLKYYLGAYDGVQEAGEDNERYAGRVQVNLFDPEPKYYNFSTYLGELRTLAFGAAYDTQSDVAPDLGGGAADYAMYTFDAFADWPLGPGSLTVEAGYMNLDLDGALQLDFDGEEETDPVDARQSEGDGWYVQAGFLIGDWQPWVEYEQWDSEAPGGAGSFDSLRFGLTWFVKGHHANVKVGYEIFSLEENFPETNEDSVGTFVAGLYMTY